MNYFAMFASIGLMIGQMLYNQLGHKDRRIEIESPPMVPEDELDEIHQTAEHLKMSAMMDGYIDPFGRGDG